MQVNIIENKLLLRKHNCLYLNFFRHYLVKSPQIQLRVVII